MTPTPAVPPGQLIAEAEPAVSAKQYQAPWMLHWLLQTQPDGSMLIWVGSVFVQAGGPPSPGGTVLSPPASRVPEDEPLAPLELPEPDPEPDDALPLPLPEVPPLPEPDDVPPPLPLPLFEVPPEPLPEELRPPDPPPDPPPLPPDAPPLPEPDDAPLLPELVLSPPVVPLEPQAESQEKGMAAAERSARTRHVAVERAFFCCLGDNEETVMDTSERKALF